MKKFNNLDAKQVERVFAMTGFNYDLRASSNEDGTENIEFDSLKDAEKFETLYKEVSTKTATVKEVMKQFATAGFVEENPGFFVGNCDTKAENQILQKELAKRGIGSTYVNEIGEEVFYVAVTI